MVKRRFINLTGKTAKRRRFDAPMRAAFPRTRRPSSNVRTGGFTGIEVKFLDSSVVGTSVLAPTDAAGAEVDPSTLLALNAIAQGDGESNRDGRRCVLKNVYVTGHIRCPKQANQTAGDDSAQIFVALVWDKQTNGAQLNSEDVYTNPGANAQTAAVPLRNLQYSQRFQVLDTVALDFSGPTIAYDGTNVEQSGLVKPFKLSKKINIPCQYTGTTGVVANIADNSLHIIAYASNVDLVPIIDYNARVRFVG